MTPTERLDILIAIKAEYPEYQVTLKDLFQVRELLPDVPMYSHPIKVRAPEAEDDADLLFRILQDHVYGPFQFHQFSTLQTV